MTLLKIKALLIENGIKVKDIAKKAHVSPVTVSIVLTGKGKSKNIQKTIARAIGMKYSDVWNNRKAA